MVRSDPTGGPGAGGGGLLERESELERLAARLQSAAAGRGATIAVEGVPGVGKSALLDAAATLALAFGMRVLRARGGPLERAMPFGVVRQLFEAELVRSTGEEQERLLSGAARFSTGALPAVGTLAAPAESDGHAVLHGLYWLSAKLAESQPLLIIVDDAHWADALSLRFFLYLARRVHELPILLAYAARPGEPGSEALPDRAEPGVVTEVLHPAPLSEEGTAALIGRLLKATPSARFARACHTVTGGNPFFLSALLQELATEGVVPDDWHVGRLDEFVPDAVARAVVARLGRLGDGPSRLAKAIAVLGTTAQLRHAAALADLSIDAAVAAADALSAAALLHPGRSLVFTHPIVHAAVYAAIPPARRAAAHRRAAAVLIAEDAPADVVAPHLLATEPTGDPVVVAGLRAAAATAIRQGDAEATCAYLDRALAEPPPRQDRPAVLCELGSAAFRAGRPDAITHLHQALAYADDDDDLHAVAAANLALALTAGRATEAAALLDPIITSLEQHDPDAAMRLDAQLIGSAQIDIDAAQPARRRLARYDGRLSGASPAERLLLSCAAFRDCVAGADATRAAELAELALADGALLADDTPDAHAFYQAVLVLTFAERLDTAEALLDAGLNDARARGSLLGVAIATTARSHVRFRQGRIADAEADAHAALELAPQAWPAGLACVVGYLLDAMLERADPTACNDVLEQAGLGGEVLPVPLSSGLLYSRGQLRLTAGDADGALRDFEELRRWDERWGMANPGGWPTLAAAALARARRGDHERARQLANEEVVRARRWGTPSAVCFALRAAGIAEGGDAGIELLCQSVAAVQHSQARYEHACSLTALGAALRRAGRPRDAREPLRQALDVAHQCGALNLTHRAHDELVAAGARPRRVSLTGLDSLTPAERRVAQMAAAGMANRTIAQALFVTVRTVEMHLTNIYDKLGISSREELPRALQPTR